MNGLGNDVYLQVMYCPLGGNERGIQMKQAIYSDASSLAPSFNLLRSFTQKHTGEF